MNAYPNRSIWVQGNIFHVTCTAGALRRKAPKAGPFRPRKDGGGRERTMAVNLSMPILVVEDHNATALILRTLLTRLGFSNVDEASDGLAAVAKLREKKYALVISDWNMEPRSGYG